MVPIKSAQIWSHFAMTPDEFYALTPIDSNGEPFSFEQLKGKSVLIVNTSLVCSWKRQFPGLEKLRAKYADDGLVVLAFPCSQFRPDEEAREPKEVSSFCVMNYGVTFPVLQKVKVNGSQTDPVYKYLKSQKPGLFGLPFVKWNFEKFLVDPNGNVIKRWSTVTSPERIDKKIESLVKHQSAGGTSQTAGA